MIKIRQKRQTQGSVNLTVGNPAKKIFLFTLPLLIGNVFQLMYSWTDAIILGNVSGDTVSFAALSASLPVVNFLITVILGFMAGASVIIGQYFGNKKYDELKKCYSTLLISLLVLALVFMGAGMLLSKPLLRLIRVDESLVDSASQYLKIYFLGILFMISYNVFAQALRSLGNSFVPLLVLILCTLLNIGLDLLFVMRFNMGISGVAIATLMAQAVSSIVLFLYIQIKVPMLRLGKKDIKYSTGMLKRTLRIAVPSTIQNICACVGFMVIHAIINSKSINFTTAFGLGARIDELLNQVTASFGVAITSYAAQNKGKGEIKRISKGFWYTAIFIAVFMGAMCALILPFKSKIINLFIRIDDSGSAGKIDINEVIRLTQNILNIYVPSFFLLSFMQLTSGLLRGTGKAATSMSINVFSLIVRMIAAFSLLNIEMGVIFASPIGWGAGAAWGLGAFFIGGWKKNKIEESVDSSLSEPDLEEHVDEENLKAAMAVLEARECATAENQETIS